MIKPHIKNMHAYKPPLEGRGKQYLLCDFNERIDPVSKEIKEAIINFLDNDILQIYPSYFDFTDKLSKYAGVNPGQVMFTNGSDQGIELIFRATCSAGDTVIIPLPSFAMYRQVAEAENLIVQSPTYTDNFDFPLSELLAVVTDKTKLIVIGNPNNPTGTLLSADNVLNIARSAPNAAILVDECYFEYTKTTVKDYIDQYPNLFITRTFSKTWGLSSLRIGYILSNSENINNLLKIRGPYDVNQIAIVAASAALDNKQYMVEYVDEVVKTSIPLLVNYLKSKDLQFWPPSANFILAYFKDSASVLEKLKNQGILVRPQKGIKLDGSLRISVGREADTKRLIQALENAL